MQETGQRRAAERVLAPWSLSSGILPCSRCASEGFRELVSGTGSGCPPGIGILTLRAACGGTVWGYSRHGQNRAKCLKRNKKLAGEPGFEPGLTESESAGLPLTYSPRRRLKTPSPNGSCISARSRHRQRSTSRRSWLRCSHRHQLVKPVSSSRLRNWPPRVHRHESIQVLSSWSAVLRAGSPSPMPHCNIKACVSLKKPPYAAP